MQVPLIMECFSNISTNLEQISGIGNSDCNCELLIKFITILTIFLGAKINTLLKCISESPLSVFLI